MKNMNVALCGLVLVLTSTCFAQTPFNSFGMSNSFDPQASLPVRGPESPAGGGAGAAVMFELPFNEGGTLDSITVALRYGGQPGLASDRVNVAVHAGDATQVGPVLWERTVAVEPLLPVVALSTGATGPVLEELHAYWLVVTPADASATVNWHLNDQNITGTVATREWDAGAGMWGVWSISGGSPVPAARVALTQMCYANCDGSWQPPILNIDDFTCFINEFAAAHALTFEQQLVYYANCDGSTVAPVLNVDDFTCFINAFAQGCP